MVHGFSDHINIYNPFFPKLAERGIEVVGWDQRGWGRSPKSKKEYGITGTTERVIADIVALLKEQRDDVPLFIIGHSMGGGEVITLAADPRYQDIVKKIRGFLLSSPYIGLAPEAEPSSLKVFLGRLTGRLLPHWQLKFPIPPEKVTHEPDAIKELSEDPLTHYTGTLEGIASLLDRTFALTSGKVNMSENVKSLWMGAATEDHVVNYPKAKQWFEAQTVQDKTVKPYEGMYHQLFRETCRDELADDIATWILERSEVGETKAQSKL
jgi:acylglycerol lipase